MFNFLTPNGMPYSSSLGNNSSVPGETISEALNFLYGPSGNSLQAAYNAGNTITVDNIIDINHDFSDTYARSLLAIDQLSIAMLDGGTYLGRTRVAENNYYISNLGRCWTVPSIPANPFVLGVAISADGRIMFSNQRATGMYRSLDYGITWTQNLIDVNDSWGIGMSADGKHVVRSRYAGRIYISHDYGTTFAEVPSSSVGWYRGFAVSADGKYMVAYWGNGGVSMSSDYGDTWYMTTSTCDNHSYASISSDGKIIIVGSLVGNAQISYDYGDTWSDLTLVGAGLSSAMSASGRHIVAAIKNNSIYISHDYGRTWSVSYAPALAWSAPSMSDDGNIIVVSLDVPGSIYISKDRGLTWEIVAFGKATFMTKLSASGNTIISATVDGGGPNGYVEFSKADTVMNSSNMLISHTIDGVADADMIRQTYAIRVDDASNIPYIKVKMIDDSVFENQIAMVKEVAGDYRMGIGLMADVPSGQFHTKAVGANHSQWCMEGASNAISQFNISWFYTGEATGFSIYFIPGSNGVHFATTNVWKNNPGLDYDTSLNFDANGVPMLRLNGIDGEVTVNASSVLKLVIPGAGAGKVLTCSNVDGSCSWV
jgi:hypothetical protein